jgi:transposase
MDGKSTTECCQCQELQQRMAELEEEMATLRAENTRLQQQLAAAKKDSSTSSKPPSSDIVKPPPAPPSADGSKRKIGGQPGHSRHERPLLPPEQLTEGSHRHTIDICPCCNHDLQPSVVAPRVVQQIDICDVPITSVEHQSFAGWCPHCQCNRYAPLPNGIEIGGLIGPRLTALIAYMKGVCHASYSTIRKFLRDVVRITISRGQLAKVIGKVTDALTDSYEEVYDELGKQAILNVDETGHKNNGDPWWTWCFRAELFTVFKIDPRRSGDVLIEVLGREFAGVIGCDYFSAYRRYMRECHVLVQFCLAHLIRDIKFLTTLPGVTERAYGERLREKVRDLFRIIHLRERLNPKGFEGCLQEARQQLVQAATENVPATRACQNMAKRFQKHGEGYFRFITTPGLGPTNNLAEQAIRFVVIDRHITQGTRSEGGQRWCERIWTVIATCGQRCLSVLEFLTKAVQAYFDKQPGPSLLPNGEG